MGKIFTRPVTAEQRKTIAARKQVSNEDILRAQDDLFMNLLNRVSELEKNKSADTDRRARRRT